MKALTIAEIDRLLASISCPRLRCAVTLGFRHGLRVSEITGLKWTDIDLTAKTIVCRRLKNSLRTVQPLAESEIAALSQLDGSERSDYVFPSQRTRERGRPGRMSRITLGRQFKAACLLAGLPPDKSHIHVLKHSLGRALVAANVNMAIIKQALGHRSINSTAIYTAIDDETTGKVVQNALG